MSKIELGNQIDNSGINALVALVLDTKDSPCSEETAQYKLQVFNHMASVLDGLERLRHANVFLSHFPKNVLYAQSKVEVDHWVRYHLGVFVSALITVSDGTSRLVNVTLELGLKSANIKSGQVMQKIEGKKDNVYAAMKNLDELVKNYRNLRNVHQHKGVNIHSEKLWDWDGLLLRLRVDPKDYLKKAVAGIYENYLPRLAEGLYATRNAVVVATGALFATLTDEYLLRIEADT